MKLEDLGYSKDLETYRIANGLEALTVGRVVAEHRERYVVRTAEMEYHAEVLGNLRYAAKSRADFPAAGDWVTFSIYDDDKGLIHAVLPRKSILERQAVGTKGETQIIAANIDTAFIVQALDRDYSINRIERYLTICNSAKVLPIVVFTKIDLVDDADLNRMIETVKKRVENVLVVPVSNKTQEGIEELRKIIEQGKTYCLLGSSGVGKSSLLNSISGQQMMKTDEISEHSSRGRHITTHRELLVLEGGGIIIDNPGMREVGIASATGGLEMTFDKIAELSGDCKFKDCTHTVEPGCAVISAVESGEIDNYSYENYLKMEREKEHYESSVAERRKKDRAFGKMVKQVKKAKKSE